MASVPVGLASTQENTNYACLCGLLGDVGCKVLRETFDSIHPPANLHEVLSSDLVRCALMVLSKKGYLSFWQYEKLFPAVPLNVSSANFDFTLLVVLLENICGLRPPVTTGRRRKRLPRDSDNSREANIARLKFCRNIVYANATKESIDDETFNSLWQQISSAILALASKTNNCTIYATSISRLKFAYMDPVAQMENGLKKLEKAIADLKYEIEKLRGMLFNLSTATI